VDSGRRPRNGVRKKSNELVEVIPGTLAGHASTKNQVTLPNSLPW
jgi:hypothetical protein